ncbi:MAG TPA: biotin/lipoyl-containing protein [bacterium]|nr:biotin/lipoyl-containing protein [bacterium]
MKKYEMKINGKDYNVEIKDFNSKGAKVAVNGKTYDVGVKYSEAEAPVIPVITRKAVAPIEKQAAQPAVQETSSGSVSSVFAPMPGLILKILVKPGDSVSIGQKVVSMEAMKMENDINSTIAGTVKEVQVKEGDNVREHQSLLTIG